MNSTERAAKVAEITERAAASKGDPYDIRDASRALTDRAALLAIVAELEKDHEMMRDALKWYADHETHMMRMTWVRAEHVLSLVSAK